MSSRAVAVAALALSVALHLGAALLLDRLPGGERGAGIPEGGTPGLEIAGDGIAALVATWEQVPDGMSGSAPAPGPAPEPVPVPPVPPLHESQPAIAAPAPPVIPATAAEALPTRPEPLPPRPAPIPLPRVAAPLPQPEAPPPVMPAPDRPQTAAPSDRPPEPAAEARPPQPEPAPAPPPEAITDSEPPAAPEQSPRPPPRPEETASPAPAPAPTPAPASGPAGTGAAAPAGRGGTAATDIPGAERQRLDWARAIHARIDRAKRRPDSAARGQVQLHLRIAADGALLGVGVARPSGHPALDRAATEAVTRAGRFPPAPATLGPGPFTLALTVGFTR